MDSPATIIPPLLLGVIACVLVCRPDLAGAEADTTIRNHWCNKKTLPDSSNEVDYINQILQYAVYETPNPNDGFKGYFHYQGYFASASCSTTTSLEDCRHCLVYADGKLYTLCNTAVGAQITLGDCRLRFEKYYFDENW